LARRASPKVQRSHFGALLARRPSLPGAMGTRRASIPIGNSDELFLLFSDLNSINFDSFSQYLFRFSYPKDIHKNLAKSKSNNQH